ncbi:MAG TPA: DinB family protein [Vicinamibacterales bacterium]|nr:DinB family protein [Vicinamibacterales bacterium]
MTNREFFTQLCTHEHPRFVGVLEAMPKDKLDYRPHPKSRSAYELVGHLIGHEQDLVELLETGSINHRVQVPFQSMDEAVDIYRKARKAVEAKLPALSDSAWDESGKFLVNGNTIMEMPRHGLAWMLMLDAIHHRGQLSTHLRPMGGKVPSIYGPSGDTAMGG